MDRSVPDQPINHCEKSLSLAEIPRSIIPGQSVQTFYPFTFPNCLLKKVHGPASPSLLGAGLNVAPPTHRLPLVTAPPNMAIGMDTSTSLTLLISIFACLSKQWHLRLTGFCPFTCGNLHGFVIYLYPLFRHQEQPFVCNIPL